MKEIETLYINCDKNQDIARLGSSQIWRIDRSHIYPHISTMACLSPLFHSAQFISDFYCDAPHRVSCLIEEKILESILEKFKDDDTENIYDRLKWYIKNLLPPKNGIIFTFYTGKFKNIRYEQPWALTSMWPMKKENKPLNEYITYHPLENAFFTDNRSFRGEWEKSKVNKLKKFYPYYQSCLNIVKNICHENGYGFYPVDYSQKYQETYELLLGSNCHFTYGAGTTTLSMACNTPTFHITGGIIGNDIKKTRTIHNAYMPNGEKISYEYDLNHPISTNIGHHKSDKGESYTITRDYKLYSGVLNSWEALYSKNEIKIAALSHINI